MGGGIYDFCFGATGTLTLSGCTLYGTYAKSGGGGIAVEVRHVTVSGLQPDAQLPQGPVGGGIWIAASPGNR